MGDIRLASEYGFKKNICTMNAKWDQAVESRIFLCIGLYKQASESRDIGDLDKTPGPT
jgi:hypothetical protein